MVARPRSGAKIEIQVHRWKTDKKIPPLTRGECTEVLMEVISMESVGSIPAPCSQINPTLWGKWFFPPFLLVSAVARDVAQSEL